jgi:catechol 2,3-dioxygenase-like lactoylglutathione lyase family enzyme
MEANGSNPARDGYTGFAEVVVSVSHFGRVAGLVQAGGWELLHAGPGAPELRTAWGLKPHAQIQDQLVHVPSMPYGYLRFTHIGNVTQEPIRPLDARPWETGGLWLLYTRSADDTALSRALGDAGWPTVRGVHGFDFGELAVNEVHHHGPDGMVLSIIEQLKPPLAIPAPKLTHVFNAAIIVRDFDGARRFFIDQLGFRPWMEVEWSGDNPGLTLLADLAAFRGVKTVRTVIVHPQGENLGSVELIGWEGAQPGRDFAERARPPNLGAMALRFGVQDLAAHLQCLRGHGIFPARPVTELTLEPYGRVRLAPVRSPDGVWLEFFEVLA